MTIRIEPYDPRWPSDFERERRRIHEALGDTALRIDHHGSTAVPGLAAKPVIDIQVSVARLRPIDAYAPPLARIGYLHVPHDDDARCPFFHRPAEWPHTHHLHVVTFGSEEEQRTLTFRDYLREHPEAARDYEALKRRLAAEYRGDDAASRESYAIAKSAFVQRIIEAASR